MKKLNELQSYLTRLRGLMLTLIILCSIGSGNVWGAYTYSGTGTFKKQSTIDGDGYYVIILTNSGAMTNSASSNYVGVNTGYNGTSSATISNPATSVVLQVTKYDSTNKKYYINNNSGNYLYSSGDKKIAYSATSQYWEIATVSNKARLKTAQATVVYMGYYSGSGFRPYTNRSSNVQSVSAIYKLAAATSTLTVSKSSITGLTYVSGSGPSTAQTFTVSGSNLTSNVTVTAPTNFEVSKDGSSYAGSQTITASGTLSATTIYVRLKSGLAVNSYSGNITVASTGATSKTVSLSGSVTAPSYTVVWTINPAAGGSLSATSGTSTTVTPDDAYTYGDPAYTVTTGSATVSQSTNTFTATPSANCTIRINMVEKPKYTITYHVGSGTCATASWTQTSYGESTTLPSATPTATCDGWSFAGWCTSSAGDEEDNTTSPGTILTGSYTPTSDMTLYAVYTKEGTGGGSTPASITLTQSDFGASYPSGQNTGTITKGDYSFTYGQYRKNQNGAPNDWCQNQLIQARYTLNIGLWNTTAMDITSVVLYKASPTANASKWAVYEGTSSAKPTSGAITVSTGSASSITADKYYSGSCHSEELTGVTETPLTYTTSSGCKYINIAPTNGTSYFTKIIINYTTSGGSTTYYMTSYTCCANVVAAPTVSATNIHYNQFTLSWTNVTGADSYNVTCTGGTPGAIQSDGTTRTCTITGLASPNTSYSWTVVATYSGSYCGATPAAGSTTTAQVYTVTYNANDGTVSPLPSTVSYEAGVTVTVAAEPGSTSKSGCTFTGWNTQADGQGTHYAASGSATFIMPSAAVTLYAEWTKKKNYYVDRMHGTNDGHTVTIGGVVYNCYLREGANYTVPTISDNTTGASACHSEHDHLLFWVTESSVNDDGTLKGGYTEVTPGDTKTAQSDGTIYYAIWGKLAD